METNCRYYILTFCNLELTCSLICILKIIIIIIQAGTDYEQGIEQQFAGVGAASLATEYGWKL